MAINLAAKSLLICLVCAATAASSCLKVHGQVFGTKACVLGGRYGWRAIVQVPDTWKLEDCNALNYKWGGKENNVMCLFETDAIDDPSVGLKKKFSVGVPWPVTPPKANKPIPEKARQGFPPNCGWE
jgi:hypothetical protein